MSDDFNPYHKWLGIPLKDQPADHYRLLGIARFESDPDVITGASDQRMQFLHSLRTDERSKRVDKLLNEIANAKVCLLHKEKKAAYDKSLRGKTTVEKEGEESTAKPRFKADAETTSQRRSRPTRSSRRTTKEKAQDAKPTRSLLPIIAAVVVTLLVIGGGLLFYLGGEAKKQEQQRLAQVAEEKAAEKAAEEEAQRQAKEEAARQAKIEAQRKAAADKAAAEKAAAEKAAADKAAADKAAAKQVERKAAQQVLGSHQLSLIKGTWRLRHLETKLYRLQQPPTARGDRRTSPQTPSDNWNYHQAMLAEFNRRTADNRTKNGRAPKPLESEWTLFMATHHPRIDARKFGLTKGKPQPFYQRAQEERSIFDSLRNSASRSASPAGKSTGPAEVDLARANALRGQIQNTYQMLEKNPHIKVALWTLGQRLGDPPAHSVNTRISPNAKITAKTIPGAAPPLPPVAKPSALAAQPTLSNPQAPPPRQNPKNASVPSRKRKSAKMRLPRYKKEASQKAKTVGPSKTCSSNLRI